MKSELSHLLRFIRYGAKNIWLHKLRSLLTILGILFGVSSVIAMLAIGEGASYEAREAIKQLGSNNIILRSVPPTETSGKAEGQVLMTVYGLTKNDLQILQTIPSISSLTPTWEVTQSAWVEHRSVPIRLVATTPSYAQVTNLQVAEGRFFSHLDAVRRQPVAVIGSSVKDALFPMEDAIGKVIMVKSSRFTVVGIAGTRAVTQSAKTFLAQDINYDVYVPLETARSYFGEFEVKPGRGPERQRVWVVFHRIVLQVAQPEKILETAAVVNSILAERHRSADFEVLVPLELLKQAEETKRIFNIVLGSIAAISLLVGGIGIMNMMLMTVTERTKEIGIRRALGAKKRDIIWQFLTESVILSSTGGILGIALGMLIPLLVSAWAGMTTIVTVWSICLAFTISVGVGVIFGLYPARQAAGLDPIQALRYE